MARCAVPISAGAANEGSTMTIKRKSFEITAHEHKSDPNQSAVTLAVIVEGQIEDRGDALLMLGDAWCSAVRREGYDLVKCLEAIRTSEGSLDGATAKAVQTHPVPAERVEEIILRLLAFMDSEKICLAEGRFAMKRLLDSFGEQA